MANQLSEGLIMRAMKHGLKELLLFLLERGRVLCLENSGEGIQIGNFKDLQRGTKSLRATVVNSG